MMAKEKAEIIDQNPIKVNDSNYLMTMEILYNYPGEFTGKQIEFTGFVYNDEVTKDNNLFLFRFGIIHCVADSGVFGMLVQMPEKTNLKKRYMAYSKRNHHPRILFSVQNEHPVCTSRKL